MMFKEVDKSGLEILSNLSPNSEWRHSMMGLSGRDPVFFAQLERERALHPELADQIDNNCLSCHTVMGQRQWKKDHGSESLFTYKIAQAVPGTPHAKYGALARDGISCVVCHQMSPEDLGMPSTFSGKFKMIEVPSHVFGPFEKLATLPMEQAIGITPKWGAHISKSLLCASCHTIALPNGWNSADPNVHPILPHGAHEDADYRNGEGRDRIIYEIPIERPPNAALTVCATLYYQSLPPYYLRQQFENLDRPAAQKLFYLINQIDLSDTPTRDWKLKIDDDRRQAE